MTQALIVLLAMTVGALAMWALSRRKAESLPAKDVEKEREKLREEEAAAVEEAKERIDEERKMDLVDWLRGFARRRDPGDR